VTLDRTSLAVALVFVISAAVTVQQCGAMSAMPGMDMPGGWVMSMTWMRMPGQGWLEHAALFLGMWAVMMIAMMTPVLGPLLTRHRRAGHDAGLTACMAAGYFSVWIMLGVVLFPLGVAFAECVMRAPAFARAVPVAAALVVMVAGGLQFTAWKTRLLACCRPGAACGRDTTPNYRAAWRKGMVLGGHCVRCCAGPTAVLLVLGVMDLRAMALVTAAIAAERLIAAPAVARAIGGAAMLGGLWMLAQSL
jgi:predicted metal-binding membrane protein